MKFSQEIIESIAKVCHDANRSFCQTIGDDSQPTWEDAPDWQKDSARAGVQFHLEAERTPSESHESWSKQKLGDGWIFGAKKDPIAKTHPCLVPFGELPVEQQAKDFLFRSVVHAFRDATK